MRATLALLVLTGCGVEPSYRTRCGLAIEGNYPGFEQDTIQAIEDASIANAVVSCSRIPGYRLVVNEAGDFDGKSGLANCITGEIRITSAGPEVLFHEFHHVEQGCWPPLPVDEGLDLIHANWNRDGVFERIRSAWADFDARRPL